MLSHDVGNCRCCWSSCCYGNAHLAEVKTCQEYYPRILAVLFCLSTATPPKMTHIMDHCLGSDDTCNVRLWSFMSTMWYFWGFLVRFYGHMSMVQKGISKNLIGEGKMNENLLSSLSFFDLCMVIMPYFFSWSFKKWKKSTISAVAKLFTATKVDSRGMGPSGMRLTLRSFDPLGLREVPQKGFSSDTFWGGSKVYFHEVMSYCFVAW